MLFVLQTLPDAKVALNFGIDPATAAMSQEARRRCKVATHKALVTRLLFILTRCSRLVVPEEPSPAIDSTALYTQVCRLLQAGS